MPDTVGTYARQDVADTKVWSSASPLEEHSVKYSTGTSSKDVTLIVAQWAKADNAKTQYDSLVGKLSGEKTAAGNVKVSGQNTGAYEVHKSTSNSANAIAVWRNNTCVFQVEGSQAAVKDFYQKFPL
jgi:nucleoside diphosphate kinase